MTAVNRNQKLILTISFVVVAIILILCGVFLISDIGSNVTIIPPTCVENGYSIYEKNGITEIKDITVATGHTFDNWVILKEAGNIDAGFREHTCIVCGTKETESYYKPTNMATLYFDGDMSRISKTSQVMLKARFSVGENTFVGYASMKYQGHSSLRYDKKNYTVKFFEDENYSDKAKFTFDNWNPENKFILKANYTDVSRCRNLICADVWSQMVGTRQEVNNRLLDTSNNGAVDGFPVLVYINDEFAGLYTLTLHKDDDLFEMKDGRKDGIVIINEGTTPEAQFKSTVNWENSNDWEIEYCGTEDKEWIEQKLNTFIGFVANSSDEELSNRLSEYVDVNSLIDYMIVAYALGLTTNFTKDLIFITYDDDVWIASLFDMETAFGLLKSGESFSLPAENLPFWNGGVWYSGTDSILWDRFINLFYDRIAERYAELRKTVLREEHVIELIENRLSVISEDVNSADFILYPSQPMQDISHSDQIKDYVSERLVLLDEIFKN